jgi:hypothetical protein
MRKIAGQTNDVAHPLNTFLTNFTPAKASRTKKLPEPTSELLMEPIDLACLRDASKLREAAREYEQQLESAVLNEPLQLSALHDTESDARAGAEEFPANIGLPKGEVQVSRREVQKPIATRRLKV